MKGDFLTHTTLIDGA